MKDTCVHHWMLEPPSGGFSVGVCKICGDTIKTKSYFASYNRPNNLVKRGEDGRFTTRDKGRAP